MSLDVRAPAATVSAPARLLSGPVRALVIIAPASLTAALGLWGIRRQNTMWGDEAVTYQLAQREPSQIWDTVQQVDLVHAPDPQEMAKTDTLERHFREYATTRVNGAQITVYVRDRDPSPKGGPPVQRS
ncbi:hypothetical protein [Streptomyces sp. HB132]|uniref:hypothetical protein n=1 Tax=Streptomyces sp. HB132 TaxID=767388 RepID=UPI0019621276|nr:hypothetical protein [Streptomyces sp. HB132]MBM7439302.1 hypothetical protein [Streptomyces sp. HB132]